MSDEYKNRPMVRPVKRGLPDGTTQKFDRVETPQEVQERLEKARKLMFNASSTDVNAFHHRMNMILNEPVRKRGKFK